MTPEESQNILRKCWLRETSGDPEGWRPENPAWMQCAASALVAMNLLGGNLVRGEATYNKIHVFNPHWWNLLPDGQEIDFTKEQFPENTVFRKLGVVKNTRNLYSLLSPGMKKKYSILRLTVQNQIEPNLLFSDQMYRLCLEASLESECEKMRFGCVVVYEDRIIAATANKIIEPLRHLCEPDCIRMKIQSRTESMIGACGHAEEWALQRVFRRKIDPELCSFYIAGFDAKTNSPWIRKEAADFTCLRCAVQMHMAGIGKIWVPLLDHWTCLSAKKAVEKSAAYALRDKKI